MYFLPFLSTFNTFFSINLKIPLKTMLHKTLFNLYYCPSEITSMLINNKFIYIYISKNKQVNMLNVKKINSLDCI